MKRTCENCGTTTPDDSALTCRKCRTVFSILRCSMCGRFLPLSDFYAFTKKPPSRCKICEQNHHKLLSYEIKHKNSITNAENRNKKFADDLEAMKQKLAILKSQTLTELEWLRVCNYFGGCALCGEVHIERRSFFIPVTAGGTYSRFNVFPTCAKCDVSLKKSSNTFNYFYNKVRSDGRIEKERFDKLVAYLNELIEEGLKDAEKTSGI